MGHFTGATPVMPASRLKKPRLRALLISQLTGGD
jgi:hypothetical protein